MTALKEMKAATEPTESPRARGQSGVSYPYFDLGASIKVAEAIHARGGGSCSPEQLAFWLDYKSTKSGTYLTRVAAARNFGLIQSSSGRLTVTDRGMAIVAPVMPEDAMTAKAEAFLSVELFMKVFEQFRGKQLPPEVGLKNLFKSAPYFIVADRIDPAVRVFMNSAEQAGFLTGDRSRLISPSVVSSPNAKPETPKPDVDPPVTSEKPKNSSGGDGTGGVHSAIVGLLRELPPPGTVWSTPKKQRFLDAFKATIDFIYPEDSA